MSALTSLVYLSRSLVEGPFERSAITAILQTAQRNNAAEGITGAFMLDDGQFLQVLEGDRIAVDRRFARIKADPRHTDVAVIGQKSIINRRFAHWSMTYLSAAKANLGAGAIPIQELRRSETREAAGVIDVMAKLAMPVQDWAED